MRREVNYDEVFDAQQHFRLILDSMSRPGKINVFPELDILPPAGINKASGLVALALLNTDVSFYAAGENQEEFTAYLALNTAAKPESVTHADFIFINGLQNPGIIFEAKTGNLSYPEESATFIVDVTTITDDAADDALMLIMKGPGIQTEKKVFIKGITADLLNAVKEQNLEFPLGVDLILVDTDNRVICIPRSNQFVVQGEHAGLAEKTI